MRILHTADWHLGRQLEGRSRFEEQAAFIDELVTMVKEERIDLILMAGDVYDTANPPAEAEELFYEALARLSHGGKVTLAFIAGNHDHPDRLAAASPLLKGRSLHLLGRPGREVIPLTTAKGEEAVLYALPYPSEARLRESFGEQTGEDEMQKAYDARVAALFLEAGAHFRADTVNLAMSHLFVAGGMESESEREIQVGGAYTVNAPSLPAGAHYVALGHLHRPQNVGGSPSPARYAGSPLAYSFSEAGYAKSVTVIEAEAGKAAAIQEIYIRSGKPLVVWKAAAGLPQVYQWLEEGRDKQAWLQIDLHVTEPPSQEEIIRLRKAHPGIIHIRTIYPEMEEKQEFFADRSLPLEELFRRFYRRKMGGREADAELVSRFLSLLEGEEEDAPDPIKN